MALPGELAERDQVVDVVRAAFATVLETPEADLDPGVPLAELPNMESVRFLRAVAVLEDEVGVVIPDEALYEVGSIGELADWLLAAGNR